MSISITFHNPNKGTNNKIDCYPDDNITECSEEIKLLIKQKYVLIFQGQLIDNSRKCKEFKDKTINVEKDEAKDVVINIYYKKENKLKKYKLTNNILFKWSTTVKDLKEKILTVEELLLESDDISQENIDVSFNNEPLNNDERFFTYRKDDNFELDVYIHIPSSDDKTEKYYFQTYDGKSLVLDLKPNQTFFQINKDIDDLKDQDFAFFFNDQQIKKIKEISDFNDAKNEETPIKIEINYLIHIVDKTSNNISIKREPFSQSQTIGDVLNQNIIFSGICIEYDGETYKPTTKLSDIIYSKDKPLIITIPTQEYHIKIDNNDEISFFLRDEFTVKQLINKIREDEGIDSELGVYKGDEFSQNLVEMDSKISDAFQDNNLIIYVKKVKKYEITFNDETHEEIFDLNCTVRDLLESNETYKSVNPKYKLYITNEGKELNEDQLLSELSSQQIKIDILKFYKFKFNDTLHEIEIPDGTSYFDVIPIIKSKFDELREKPDDLIGFNIKEGNLFDFKFGPKVDCDETFEIEVDNPSYEWPVCEDINEEGEVEAFSFPPEFSVSDAIKEIEEKKYENKFSILILEKKGKKFVEIDKEANLYENYNMSTKIKVLKCGIEYAFSASGEDEFRKRFKPNDKIGQIAIFLKFNAEKKAFSFSEKELSNHVSEHDIEFTYKDEKFNCDDEFEKLNYDPNENLKIVISILPPTYPIYSLEQLTKLKCEKIEVKDIKKKINNDFKNILLYDSFRPLENSDDYEFNPDIQTVIDCFSYEMKINIKRDDKEDFESLYINDENTTIDEIKIMAAAKLNYDKIVGPDRIKLTCNNKEISGYLFKEVEYDESQFVSISFKPKLFKVKVEGKEEPEQFEIDDDDTIFNLQQKIDPEKAYIFKFKGKELQNDQKLCDLHIPKEDYIDAETVKDRVLEFKGKKIKLDEYREDKIGLQKAIENEFGIDVNNCQYMYGDKEYKLNKFNELPEGAKVEVRIKEIKFKNFNVEAYNDKFYTHETLADVRKKIYEDNPDNMIQFVSGGKVQPDKTKLFQVKEKIDIKELTENCYEKKLIDSEGNELATEYFGIDITGKDLKFYVNSLFESNFKLTSDGIEINDNDKICQFGKEIKVVKPTDAGSDAEPEQVTFYFNDKLRIADYSEMKTLSDYMKTDNIKKTIKDKKAHYLFFTQGKLLTENDNLSILKNIDEDDRIVKVFKDEGDDMFNESAKSVKRFEKPQLELTHIIVDECDDKGEQLKFKYDKKPLNVGDLKQKVADKLSLEPDTVSLFIMYKGSVECFALLDDDEDVPTVLNDNPGYNINYKILKNAARSRNMIRNLRKVAEKFKVKIDDEKLNTIFKKVDSNIDIFQQTIEYIASKQP